MARGKQAARAASRRATDASDRASVLAAELANLKAATKQEIDALRVELASTRNAADKIAEQKASEQVRLADDRAAAIVDDLMERQGGASEKAVRRLDAALRGSEKLNFDLVREVADLLGVNQKLLVEDQLLAGGNRRHRRWFANLDREKVADTLAADSRITSAWSGTALHGASSRADETTGVATRDEVAEV